MTDILSRAKAIHERIQTALSRAGRTAYDMHYAENFPFIDCFSEI